MTEQGTPRRTKAEVECPSFHDHTPCPDGYIQWHAWARRMNRTHKQIRCTGCGRFAIWIPRKKEDSNENDAAQVLAPDRLFVGLGS